jgi:hypothetical protein
METFAFTFSIVWLALALYVARLNFRQQQVIQHVAELQSHLEQTKQR